MSMFSTPLAERSVKLPAINGDKSVISAQGAAARPWCQELRKKIHDGVRKDSDVDSEIEELKGELIKLFIAALQGEKPPLWKALVNGLELCLPLKECLQGDEKVMHYIERVTLQQSSRSGGFEVMAALQRVFPQETRAAESQRNAGGRRRFNFAKAAARETPKMSAAEPTKRTTPRRSVPRTEEDLFHRPLDTSPIPDPPGLTFADLSASLPHVVAMTSRYESTWARPIGDTFRALEIDFSAYEPEEVKILQKIDEELAEDSASSCGETLSVTESEKEEKDSAPLDGRQAVEYFSRLHHLGKVRVMFFNVRKQRHFDPYDLHAVPKAQVDPEHYIFSTFGVLHLWPNGPGEVISLAEWQRQAVLFKAIAQIPFFKNFLLFKIVRRWHENVKRIKYLKTRKVVSETLVTNVSMFGTSVKQLVKLLDELRSIRLLPFDTTKRYKMTDFVNDAHYKTIQAEEVLEKFHGYVQFIVNETASELLKKLKHCQEQVHHKTVFTKDSLHLQKLKKEVRMKALEDARREATQLGNFVRLVDHLVTSHFVDVVLANVRFYVSDMLTEGSDAGRSSRRSRLAGFETDVVFSENHRLDVKPSLSDIHMAILSAVKKMPGLLTKGAVSLNGLMLDSYLPKISEVAVGASSAREESRRHDKTLGEKKSILSAAELMRNVGVKELSEPESPREKLPSKEQDDLRVATPEFVPRITNIQNELRVVGEGFVGQFSPLPVSSIATILDDNDQYKATLVEMADAFEAAQQDVDQFCDDHQWLYEIEEHCRTWTENSAQEWRGVPAYLIEQKLNTVRAWTDRVRSMDSYYVTENTLIFVNCHPLQEHLVQRLSVSYKQLINFVVKEAISIGKEFVREMRDILKNLQNKSTSVEIFSQFSTNVTRYRADIAKFQERSEYFKTLLEVIRMSYRQLTSEEEKLEEQVQTAWDAFLVQIQDAAEFVSQQRQIVLKYLEDTYERLDAESKKAVEYLLGERFRDPTRKPLVVLAEIRSKRDELYNIHSELRLLSRYREMILGTPLDLRSLKAKTSAIDARQMLWKLMELASHSIKDWKNMLFKKFNVASAIDKMQEWRSSELGLQPDIDADDAVLVDYLQLLADFQRCLPLLLQLSSPAIKARHWHTLLVGFGGGFDSPVGLRVIDLLQLDLQCHATLIDSVQRGAEAEFRLEQRFLSLRKFWAEKAFKIGKYIPHRAAVRQKETERQLRARALTPKGQRRKPRMEEFESATAAAKLEANGGTEEPRDIFVLMDTDDLLHALRDSVMDLASMLASPFSSALASEVRQLHAELIEVLEISEELVIAQQKWTFLRRVLEQGLKGASIASQRSCFAPLDRRFVSVMESITDHPLVLDIASQTPGSLRFRQLQGANLLALLRKLSGEFRAIIANLGGILELFRRHFCRLFFLSNNELVDLLGVARDPNVLQPFLQRLFPGLQRAFFQLPGDQPNSVNRSIDVALNSAKLVTIGVEGGSLRERVTFAEPVAPLTAPTAWLVDFEKRLKTAQFRAMQCCLQAKLRGVDFVAVLRQRLGMQEVEVKAAVEAREVLLQVPAELVIIAERVMFARAVECALQAGGKLEELRQSLVARSQDLAEVLSALLSSPLLGGSDRPRFLLLVQRLLLCAREHQDIVQDLMAANSCSTLDFTWLRHFHYEANLLPNYSVAIETIDPSISEPSPDDSAIPAGFRQGAAAPRRSSHKWSRNLTPLGLIEETAPKVVRRRAVIRDTPEVREVFVRQMGRRHDFDYEYCAPEDVQSTLLLTPLTERALLTLTMALQHSYMGALVGPSGAGKSHTLFGLARLLGRHAQPVMCTADISTDTLTMFTVGALLNGSLMIFENLQGLKLEVLSALSQALFYLKMAIGSVRSEKETEKKTADRQRRLSGSRVSEEEVPREGKILRRHSVSQEVFLDAANFFPGENPYAEMFYDHMLVKFGKDSALHKSRDPDMGSSYRPTALGCVFYEGQLLPVRSSFGTLCSADYRAEQKLELPESMKVLFRPCALVQPSSAHLLRFLLSSCGFLHAEALQAKLSRLAELCANDFDWRLGPRHLKLIVALAARRLQRRAAGAMSSYPQPPHLPQHASAGSSPYDSPRSSGLGSGSSTGSSLFDDDVIREEEALLQGITAAVPAMLRTKKEEEAFRRMLRSVFAISAHAAAQESDVVIAEAVREQLERKGYAAGKTILAKAQHLHSSVSNNRATLLCGAPGSGKTVLLDCLVLALGHLHSSRQTTAASSGHLASLRSGADLEAEAEAAAALDPDVASPANSRIECRVECLSVHLDAYAMADLFGDTDKGATSEQREMGLLGAILGRRQRQAELQLRAATSTSGRKLPGAEPAECWLHLDGNLQGEGCAKLNGLLSSEGVVNHPSGKAIVREASCRFVLEACDLSNLEPRLLSHLAVVFLDPGTLTWNAVWTAWLKEARMKFLITDGGRVILSELSQSLIPPLEKFLSSQPRHAIFDHLGATRPAPAHQLSFAVIFEHFLRLLDTLMARHFSRSLWERSGTPGQQRAPSVVKSEHCLPSNWTAVEDNIELYYRLLESIFIYCAIWGICAAVPERRRSEIEAIMREMLENRSAELAEVLPDGRSIFDLMVDIKGGGGLGLWSDRHVEKLRTRSSIVGSPESERLKFLCELLVPARQPVLFFGPTGVGKSCMLDQFVSKNHHVCRIHLSPKLSGRHLQGTISDEHRLFLHRLSTDPSAGHGKSAAQSLVLFLDDLHLSAADPVEVVRQILRQGGTYHHTHSTWESYPKACFVATCASPGSVGSGFGRRSPSGRLLRLFALLPVFYPTDATLETIFSALVDPWLADFPKNAVDHPQFMTMMISRSLIAALSRISAEFRPSPANPHFLFSLHNAHHALRGLMLLGPRNVGRLLHTRSKLKSGRSDLSELSRHSHFPRLQDLCPLTIPVIRLWFHELTRTFQDRIENARDAARCESHLLDVIAQHFCEPLPKDAKESLMGAIQEESTASRSEKFAEEEAASAAGGPEDLLGSRSASAQGTEASGKVESERTERFEPPRDQSESETESVDDSTITTTTMATRHVGTAGRRKRGVSFKQSANDSDQFLGPLVGNLDHIMIDADGFTEVMFVTKNVVTFADDWQMDKNYVEIGPQDLQQCLEVALFSLNKATNQKLDFVFFLEAIQQIARISRALALPNGGGLLLSKSNCVGKATLTKLAAHIEHCRYFEITEQTTDEVGSLKAAIEHAGVKNRPTALFVKWTGDDDLLLTVSQILREGFCPGLFTEENRTAILQELAPNALSSGKPEKIELALRSFANAVRERLRVIVSVHGDPLEMRAALARHPALLSLLPCVSFVREWNHETCAAVAKTWLSDLHVREAVLWDAAHEHEELHLASEMLAFCHLEAAALWPGLGPKSAKRPALTPEAMRRCVAVFSTLARSIREREARQMARFRGAVERIEAVQRRMTEYNEQLVTMEPRIRTQRELLDEQRSNLHALKESYMQQLERCKEQERLVESLRQPLELLKKETQADFDQVNPMYSAALEAMRCLNQADIDELRCYQNPPEGVCGLMRIVCLLCGVEQSWQKGKELMAMENNGFFNKLQFYDKDKIDDELFHKLGKAMETEETDVAKIKNISAAAAGLCRWLHAIYNYTLICRKMNPNLGKLLAAEERVNKAQSDLGKKRMKEEAMKQNLEKKIQEHRDAAKELKHLEKETQFIENRLKEAEVIKSHLLLYEDDWGRYLDRTQMRLKTVKADALLCAIIVTYLGNQPQDTRKEVVERWVKEFSVSEEDEQTRVFHLRSSFAFKDILLSAIFKDGKLGAQVESEQITWNILILRALLLSSDQRWPMVFDPSDRLKANFATVVPPANDEQPSDSQSLESEANFVILDATKCNLETELLDRCQQASICLLHGLEFHQNLSPSVRTILSQSFFYDESRGYYLNVGESQKITCHPNFRLVLVLGLHPIQSYPGFDHLKKCQMMPVDNCLGREDVSQLILKKIVALERPEFETHVASLNKERFFGETSLFRERNHVLTEVLNSEANLIDRPDIIQTLRSSHDSILRQEEMLQENSSMMRQLLTKIAPLQGIVDNVLSLVMTLEEVTWTYQIHFCDALAFMNEMFRNFDQVVRFPGLVGSAAARCQELVNFTTRAALEFVNRIMDECQVLIFVALYCLRRVVAEGGASEAEVSFFLRRDVGRTTEEEAKLEASEHFSAEELSKIRELERCLPVFKGIKESFLRCGDQWLQYFQLPFSTASPTPEFFKFPNFTNFQKILLWKLLMPNKTKQLVTELARELLGTQVPLNRQFSVQRLLSLATPRSPVLLHVPLWSYDWRRSKGNTLIYLLDAIIQSASSEDPYSVTAVNFGHPDVWTIASDALQVMAENGGWLILQNMHLIARWEEEFLSCLEKVLDSNFPVHPKFRLFFTTEDSTRALPVILQRHGITLVCDFTTNNEEAFAEVMTVGRRMKSQLCVPARLSHEETKTLLTNIAALVAGVHVVLCHQRFAGRCEFSNDYPWQFSDLAMVLSALSNAGRCRRTVSEELAKLLTKEVYLSHALEKEDGRHADALIEAVWRAVQDAEVAKQPINRLCESIFEQITANIVERDEGIICRQLVQRLAESQRSPPASEAEFPKDDAALFSADRLHGRLEDFLSEVATSEPGKELSGDLESCLELYMARERLQLLEELRELSLGTKSAADSLSGLTAPSEASEAFAAALRDGQLPADWTAVQHAHTLDQWFAAVRERLTYLAAGGRGETKELRLLQFRNPRQLLQVLLRAEARERRRDLKRMRLQFQVEAPNEPGSYALPNLSIRGARWCPSRCRLLPAPWRQMAPLPSVRLKIFRADAAETDKEKEVDEGRCQLVRDEVFDKGEAVTAAAVLLEIPLPHEGHFARTPLLTQL